MVQFRPGERKDDMMAERLKRFDDAEGVVFIGKAQEKASVFRTQKRRSPNGQSYPWIVRSTAMVNQHYIYAVDRDFGPFFLKFSSYFPYNAKLCLNGHEYAKRQLAKEGIAFEALDNGIQSCAEPERSGQRPRSTTLTTSASASGWPTCRNCARSALPPIGDCSSSSVSATTVCSPKPPSRRSNARSVATVSASQACASPTPRSTTFGMPWCCSACSPTASAAPTCASISPTSKGDHPKLSAVDPSPISSAACASTA